MKHTFSGLVLSTALAAGCAPAGEPTAPPGSASSLPTPAAGRYVMRVDRVWGRTTQPARPDDELPPESYRAEAPADRWEVTLEGSRVVLTPVSPSNGGPRRLEGAETAPAAGATERRFELGPGAFAGGRFVLRGDEAELTMFGSGVPIVSSERGTLVAR